MWTRLICLMSLLEKLVKGFNPSIMRGFSYFLGFLNFLISDHLGLSHSMISSLIKYVSNTAKLSLSSSFAKDISLYFAFIAICKSSLVALPCTIASFTDLGG